LMESRRLTRVFAATTSAVVVWYLGLGSLLSFSMLAELRLLGQNFFEWMQWLSATLIAPLSGLLLCVLIGHGLPAELARAVAGPREQRWTGLWVFMLSYPARIAVLAILLYALGAFDWLAGLWSA